MATRVLVSYGSRNGATAELAGWIADELREQHCVVRIHAAPTVADITSYEAVILGGPVYFGRWHRACRDFVRRHRAVLVDRPVWLFSSGPLEPVSDANEPPPTAYVRAVIRGLPARGHRTFGGSLDAESGGLARCWLATGQLPGDYRDETRVRTWAADIASELDATVGVSPRSVPRTR
jgi:menaquinone-dependent protoporphyrinogen oxidase